MDQIEFDSEANIFEIINSMEDKCDDDDHVSRSPNNVQDKATGYSCSRGSIQESL